MTTLVRFAGIATLVLTGLTIVPGVAPAKAETSHSTDFFSNAALNKSLVFSGYEPSCKQQCSGPDTTQGSGSR